ncbi:MAG: glyoxylate/hydroxypyruvate reductase A [Alphaproteobacteria bacterium]|nr:MAG: glyoxylate/hydroxypyruvate reductase A [Alphaproteobacteria bacterium]
MAILFLSDAAAATAWADALANELPDEVIRVNTGPGDDGDVEFAVVWQPAKGRLARIPNLRAIFSLGAGVDHIFADSELPAHVPVFRLIDPVLTAQMAEYVVMNVLWHHRGMDQYAAHQAGRRWRQADLPRTARRRVGIMGLGVLGSAAAEALARFGFPLAGWTRTARDWPLGEAFHGRGGLRPFLAISDILVCLLPLTPETEGILDAGAFAALPSGAALINAARGGHVVEADLIDALDSGALGAATLDVFATEPLAQDHPFWAHPRVRVTPHVAAITYGDTTAREIALNIGRFRAGAPMSGLVDRARRY